jgi:hypothetical protein
VEELTTEKRGAGGVVEGDVKAAEQRMEETGRANITI